MQKRAFQPFLLTLALCALPWIAAARPTTWFLVNPSFAGFVMPLPYFLLAALAFIGVKLNQTRLFYVSLFLMASYLYLQGNFPDALHAVSPFARTLAVGMAAPLTLALIFLMPQKKVWSGGGALSIFFSLAPLEIFALGFHYRWDSLEHVTNWQALGRQGILAMPEVTTLLVAAFAVLAFIHNESSRRLLHVFLAVSLVPLWGALNYRVSPERLLTSS